MAIQYYIYYNVNMILSFLALFGYGCCGVSLNSTLKNGISHLGDTVKFSCITVGSNTLMWHSIDYIGENAQQVTRLSSTSRPNSFAVVILDATYVENDQRVLESTLTIIVQGNIPSAIVTCTSLGTGESNATSFNLAGKCAWFTGAAWHYELFRFL